MRRVLMCPPDFFVVRDVKNPFMASGERVDAGAARSQWNGLRDAFEAAGVSVLTIDAAPDLEDMVFTANQTFVGMRASGARFAIPSAMRHPSRRREVPHFTAWFSANGFDILDLGLDGEGEFLEGHGDLLWHPGRHTVWAGYGYRSSKSGVEKFARAVSAEGIDVVPLQLADPTFYHLDTCFAPLNESAALVYEPALLPSSLSMLGAGFERLHAVTQADAMSFACNGVAANGRFIASRVSPELRDILECEELTPLIADTSEFEKSGGSVFCLKNVLD